MRPLLLTIAFPLVLLSATACTDTSSEATDRAPLGKTDQLSGSCEESDCDGPAPLGVCWCDVECETYGDCCSDYVDTCSTVVCPEISPPASDFCEDGTLAPVTNDDDCTVGWTCSGEECPEIAPQAPDFCSGGGAVPVRNAEECIVGWECSTDCPDLVSPNCDDDETAFPMENDAGCVIGWECVDSFPTL